MEHSKLAWEDVSKFEEIKGYGQHVWRHHEKYFFVTDEGGIAEQRVVYELPNEFYLPYWKVGRERYEKYLIE